MADDEFSKQAGKAIQATVGAAVGLVSGPGGVALAVGAAVTFNVFEALVSRNDEVLKELRVAALEDEVLKLRDGLRALEQRLANDGKAPDRQDPLTQHAVASEFVRGITEARTVEKKEAIVHATIAQFDPRKGPAALRDYWLRRVRDLHEPQLALILLIAKHSGLGFVNGDPVSLEGQALVSLGLPRESARALYTIANTFMNRADVGRPIEEGESLNLPYKGQQTLLRLYKLSEDGQILMSFCKGD